MPKKKPAVTFPESEVLDIDRVESNQLVRIFNRRWEKEQDNKLVQLCEDLGISTGEFMFRDLALILAREVYPEPTPPGRKLKWRALIKGALVVEVERFVKMSGTTHGVNWACQQLAKQEPWLSFVETKDSGDTDPDPAEALRHVYYKFKGKKDADIMRDMLKSVELDGRMKDWPELVAYIVNNPNLE